MGNIIFQSKQRAKNDEPFLTVIDEDGFVYARRPGKDSVAFILVDENRIGLINCLRNPTGIWSARAFTGSIDGGLSPIDTCIQEVREEAGYIVEPENLVFVGLFEVGHQSDENVYLYIVDVADTEKIEREPDGKWEAHPNFKVVWNDIRTSDWKAKLAMNHWSRFLRYLAWGEQHNLYEMETQYDGK